MLAVLRLVSNVSMNSPNTHASAAVQTFSSKRSIFDGLLLPVVVHLCRAKGKSPMPHGLLSVCSIEIVPRALSIIG